VWHSIRGWQLTPQSFDLASCRQHFDPVRPKLQHNAVERGIAGLKPADLIVRTSAAPELL
jgi:hypothetical protein